MLLLEADVVVICFLKGFVRLPRVIASLPNIVDFRLLKALKNVPSQLLLQPDTLLQTEHPSGQSKADQKHTGRKEQIEVAVT